MAKAGRKAYERRDERRALFDAARRVGGVTRPGSMKKKGKSTASNRTTRRIAR